MKEAANHTIRGNKGKDKNSFEEAMDAWDKCLNWALTGEIPLEEKAK